MTCSLMRFSVDADWMIVIRLAHYMDGQIFDSVCQVIVTLHGEKR